MTLRILLWTFSRVYANGPTRPTRRSIGHWHSLSAAHWSTCAGEPGTYTESCRRLLRRKFRSRLSNEHVGKNPCVGWIQGLIQESTSLYCSPLLVVPKPDGSPQVCFDARKLNAITKKDRYPVPHVGECLNRMCGAHIFSTGADLGRERAVLLLKHGKKLLLW